MVYNYFTILWGMEQTKNGKQCLINIKTVSEVKCTNIFSKDFWIYCYQ